MPIRCEVSESDLKDFEIAQMNTPLVLIHLITPKLRK